MSQELADIDKAIKDVERQLKWVEEAQRHNRGLTWDQRLARSLRKHRASYVDVALAATLMAVAVGRLTQKYEHEVGSQCRKGAGCAGAGAGARAGAGGASRPVLLAAVCWASRALVLGAAGGAGELGAGAEAAA